MAMQVTLGQVFTSDGTVVKAVMRDRCLPETAGAARGVFSLRPEKPAPTWGLA